MSARPTFLVEEFSTVPLVEIVFALPAGSALDPRGKEGSLVLALRSLRRGAGGKTSTQLDDEIDRLGGELSTGCDALQCSLHATVISRNLEPFFALLADIALRPAFNEDEVARVRREITAELIDARNDDRTLCGRYFRRTLFAGHIETTCWKVLLAGHRWFRYALPPFDYVSLRPARQGYSTTELGYTPLNLGLKIRSSTKPSMAKARPVSINRKAGSSTQYKCP